MADLDELLVDQLNAALARNLQQFDLWLNKEVKSHFGNKQAGSRASRVSNSCSNIESSEI